VLHACSFALLKESFLWGCTLCLSFMLLCIFYNDGQLNIIREFCEIREGKAKEGEDVVGLCIVKSN